MCLGVRGLVGVLGGAGVAVLLMCLLVRFACSLAALRGVAVTTTTTFRILGRGVLVATTVTLTLPGCFGVTTTTFF